jgi:short-subunit dehydrogenase
MLVATHLLARREFVVSVGRRAAAHLGDAVATGRAEDLVMGPVDADWGALLARKHDEGRTVHACIFVAGDAAFGATAAIPESRAREVFELNFWSVARCAVACAEHWRARGVLDGVFVPVLSIAALRGVPGEAHYSASKAATARFLQALGPEYPSTRFAPVFPGLLRTNFRAKVSRHGAGAEASVVEAGTAPEVVAERVLALWAGERAVASVVGLRERIIEVADRVAPGVYDAVLRHRFRGGVR